ncbi:MAG: CHAT domain-containing tetratricopeptide repeat protein [Acidimicrobiales bacterium]|jgi:tetratricopeptide (TPR) repeat protein
MALSTSDFVTAAVRATVPPPEDDVVLAEANRALELAAADPRRALALADSLLERTDLSADGRAVSERAAALAELGLGRVAESRARFERARDRALADGVVGRLAEIQIGLAIVLLQCEEPDAAMAEIDAAIELATDEATLGRAQSQRATILMRLGRYPEALEQATMALVTCRSAGLSAPVARLLSNQGIVHAYLGDYAKAETELQEALGLLRQEGSGLGTANVVHNLGFVAARRGDVPAALAHFDEAFNEYVRLDIPAHAAFTDRCEVLLAVRLLPEARAAASQAVAGLAGAGQAADLAEAKLMLAEVALAAGDLGTAGRQAAEAAEALGRQGRAGWAALASFVAARARWAAHVPESAVDAGPAAGVTRGGRNADGPPAGEAGVLAGIVTEASVLAGQLGAAGWRVHALEASIIAARAAMAGGDVARAVSVLSEVDEAMAAPAGASSDERVRMCYAVALRRLGQGDRPAALQALKAGLQIAEEHRAAFGATELRARATLRSADLAELGLEIVMEAGAAAAVLEWSERWRARSLWPPDALPPRDLVLADGLTQLRHTVAALELAVEAGDGAAGEAEHLSERRRQLEAAIRRRSIETGRPRRSSPRVPTVADVQAGLAAGGSAAIVELVSVRGSLHAVVCTAASCVVRELAPQAELARWRAALRFALGRLVVGRGSRGSLVAVAELLGRAAAAADQLLFGPIAGDLEVALAVDGAELVLVPTGALHSLPWALLPSLRGRPVSVAPSIALYLSRSAAARQAGPTVLVAAPSVPSALAEVEAIGRLYPDALALTGPAATARAVAGAMRGAGTAHVVAHGRFRTDNALFSALELADGPLTVYELEEIGQPPELLVLSSCDSGRSDVQPGDELMGAAATMLSLGSRAIVASLVPVPDAGSPAVMTCFHQHLLAGHAPSTALSRAQADHHIGAFTPGDLADRSVQVQRALAAAGFVCLGAGGQSPRAPRRPTEDPNGARMRGHRAAAKMTK